MFILIIIWLFVMICYLQIVPTISECLQHFPSNLLSYIAALVLSILIFICLVIFQSQSYQYLFFIIHNSCRCDGLCCSFQATDSLRVDVRATLCQACAWRRGLGCGFASCHPPGHTTTTLPGSHLGRPGRQQLLPRRGQCRIVI